MKIESNIPAPSPLIRHRWPFAIMEVGQSIFVDGEIDGKRAATAAKVYGLRNGKKFTVRKSDGGHRIWRIG